MSDFGDAIDALIANVVKATAQISLEGGVLVEGLAKGNASVKTGTLRRSIDTTGPSPIGVASFTTFVGPTVVYGRIRELGGFIPGGAVPEPKVLTPTGRMSKPDRFGRSHMIMQGWLHWVGEDGVNHFALQVHQDGRPYMKPAVDAARPQYQALAARRWGDAIRSVSVK